MKKEGALLGGELSCHFTFSDRYFGFDDGIYAALRLVEYINTSNKSLDKLLEDLPQVYNTRAIRIPCKQEIMSPMIKTIKEHFEHESQATLILIDGVRVAMPYGWGLIRTSNTQPVICLRFESETQEGLKRIKQEFQKLLSSYIEPTTLTQYFGL